MTTPILHVLAGPNGSGKSTFASRVLQPETNLAFINADVIAARRWPGQEEQHAYEAAAIAARERDDALSQGRSFIAETVFSHRSKVDLVRGAVDAGYLVALHVMLVPEDLTVLRVAHRVERGGHTVPEDKIRERYQRIWPLVRQAGQIAARTQYYDNTQHVPFALVAAYDRGTLVGTPSWPAWTPHELLAEPRP